MTVLDLIFDRKYRYYNLYGNLSISGITPEPEPVIDLTDKFNYTLNGDDVEITGLTSEGTSWLSSDTLVEGQIKEVGELVIPDYLIIDGVKHLIKSIGANAFKSNLDLVKVSMSDSVEKLGYSCFSECTNLVSCRLSDNISDWGKSLVSDETNGGLIFWNCTNLQEVNIPSKVTNIPRSCFGYCSNLKNIVIDRALELGHQAFINTGLININLPEGTTLAGYSDNTNKLGSQFDSCKSLKSITLPESVRIIPYACFYDCLSLSKVIISSKIREIGVFAFNSCTSLSSIVIPNTCEKIYHLAFQNCSGLKDITLPIDCDIKDYSVGSNYRTFYNCYNIRKVTYTGGRTGLDIKDNYSYSSNNGTPYSCGQPNGSVELIFAEGVKKIRYSNFSSKDTIKSISIPNTLEYLYNGAFSYCSYMTDIYWNNVHNELYGTGSNYMLYDLGKYNSNTVFHFGNIFGETDKFIKDGVNYVPYNIFNDGSRVNGIATYLIDCYSVDWGTFRPDDLNYAFYCTKFKDVTIPDSVHTIYKNDFAWSSYLKTVRISKGTTKIEAGAFYETDTITDVYYDGTEEERNANLVIESTNNNHLLNATWHYKNAA